MKTRLPLTLTLIISVILALPGPDAGAQSAGSIDRSFNAGTNIGAVLSLAVQPDGKVVVAGGWLSFGVPPITFARLLSDGAPDPDFHTGAGPDASVAKVVLLENGKMFIGGQFTAYDNILRTGLARVNSDGSLDATFADAGLDGPVNNIALQSDGRLIITGGFSQISGIPRLRIARLHPDGSLDTAFNPGPQFLPANFSPPTFYAIAIQPNGKILLGGSFGDGGQTPLNLARINADGALDTTFQPPELLLSVFSLALLPDHKLLVGGEFWAPAVNLIRLFADGAWDEAFEANIGRQGSDPIVAALLVQPDGRIILGGQNISTAGGLERHLLARLHPDGSGDATFNPGTGPNFNWVHALTLQADGKLFVGGTFTAFDGVPAPGIARLHNDSFESRIHFSQTVYRSLESDRVATITVRRSGANTSRVRVLYAAHGGTARPGLDYHPAIGYLLFGPGETVKTFTVRLIDDRKPENTETILLRLRDRSGPLQTAILTVIDNDGAQRRPRWQ